MYVRRCGQLLYIFRVSREMTDPFFSLRSACIVLLIIKSFQKRRHMRVHNKRIGFIHRHLTTLCFLLREIKQTRVTNGACVLEKIMRTALPLPY